jgi:Putative auto-transporter adhesin, head GIN domain
LRRSAVVGEESLLKQIFKTKKSKVMKQLFFTLVAAIFFSFTASAQSTYSKYNRKTWEQLSGSGKLIQLTTPVTSFSNLEISHMNVKIIVESSAGEYSLNVSIDDNLKDFFRYRIEGTTLKLSMDLSGGKYDRWLSSNNTLITVKVPALELMTNSGNTTIELRNIRQEIFRLRSDGNADIKLQGKATDFYLQSNGNSDINAGGFVTTKTTLNTSGNSAITVNAAELVKEKANGNIEINNLFSQPVTNTTTQTVKTPEYIRFKLRNNSLMPAKLSVISYRPDEKGNGTTAFVLMPYGAKTYRFPVGTKIYLASQEQVNTVMSGTKISDQPPFLTVKKEDNNKTFNINN